MRVIAGAETRTSSGAKAVASGADDVLDERAPQRVARAAGHRQVHGVALARARALVGHRARPGIQRPLVDRDEQHLRVGVEDVVGPVAVVDVPVEDQHALEPVAVDRVPRGDRHVVEQAEPHRPRDLGVVAGRAMQRNAARRTRLQRSASTSPTAPPAACSAASNESGAGDGVEVEIAAARGTELLDRTDVAGGMHRLDQRSRARARLAHLPAQPVAASSSCSIAVIRAARSGCAPVSWRSDDGWRSSERASHRRVPYPAHESRRPSCRRTWPSWAPVAPGCTPR